MANAQQNNKIKHINKEINLLQDRRKENKKSQNQFQNGLMQIRRILVKKGQRANLYQTKKIQNIVKNIFQNKIEQIKKNTNLLQNILAQVKKRKRLFEKGLKKIAKMQNLSQNEFNQITEMSGPSLDELDQITKTRRIKNYEEMTEELISLLKSKQSIVELFNNNSNNNNNNNNNDNKNNNSSLYDNKTSDTRRILNRLRDVLPKKYRKKIKEKLSEIKQENFSEVEKEENDEDLRKLGRIPNDFDYYGIRDIQNLFDEVSEEDYYKPILVKSSFKVNYKYYESRGHKEKRLSVRQYLNKITLQLYDLIKDRRIAKRVWKIQISMRINFISSKDTGETRTIFVWSDNASIMQGSDTDDIIRKLFRSFT